MGNVQFLGKVKLAKPTTYKDASKIVIASDGRNEYVVAVDPWISPTGWRTKEVVIRAKSEKNALKLAKKKGMKNAEIIRFNEGGN